MYGNQQYPMGAGGAFSAAPNQGGMMPGAGPAGMMPNTAMPQMSSNGHSKSHPSLDVSCTSYNPWPPRLRCLLPSSSPYMPSVASCQPTLVETKFTLFLYTTEEEVVVALIMFFLAYTGHESSG